MLMAQQLSVNPQKVPAHSRDEMMKMLVDAWDSLHVDVSHALKENFITNALDGSEDILVSDRLFQFVGKDVVEFRKEMLQKNHPTASRNFLTPYHHQKESIGLEKVFQMKIMNS
jgi:hypothetical protein